MKKMIVPLIAATTLAGCMANTPIPIETKPAASQFIAADAQNRLKGGETKTIIRAFKNATNDKGKTTRQEIKGAKCDLRSDHLKATVVTPQEVVLPKYDQDRKLPERGVPPSILVTCRADGLEGSTLLTAKAGKIVSGSGHLAVDLILIAGSAAAANTANWRYEPEANVTVQ